jgi:hypothetical protein
MNAAGNRSERAWQKGRRIWSDIRECLAVAVFLSNELRDLVAHLGGAA